MTDLNSFRSVYKVVDNQEIDADIYLPQNEKHGSSAKYPVIINIHGGAFMLGYSKMVNMDQIEDCLSRKWIVVVPNHRLCPQVNLLEGPIRDCRDLLSWIYDGGLQASISSQTDIPYALDLDHVFAFGTSSGGTLALSLGFDVARPVAGIFDMYGPCSFSDPFWKSTLTEVKSKLPTDLSDDFLSKVFNEDPVPIRGGVSLEGQRVGGPNFDDPRQAYALTQIANGRVMDVIFPSADWDKVDPIRNISSSFPPTFIVHGDEDRMVPQYLSKGLLQKLTENGVKCGLRGIPDEGHTFAAKMKVGSQTWNLQREGFDFLESLI
ncbi:Alpha/Beta hydrolase protein [Dactylonectria macrodidyma]|uniref:Alpha/Beta hydrolase protein n=1 Tax=Dactylonectria macrodidyma TaxID=307937 RepID=A0A9P9J279_9HYPO|nr:Alpha/Beta hydrolase protein [Dactylonectria macrodidyma]